MDKLLGKLFNIDFYIEDERAVAEYALYRSELNITDQEWESLVTKIEELGYTEAMAIANMFGLPWINVINILKTISPNKHFNNDILINTFEEDGNLYFHFFVDFD